MLFDIALQRLSEKKVLLLLQLKMANWEVFKSSKDLQEFLNSDNTEILYQGNYLDIIINFFFYFAIY